MSRRGRRAASEVWGREALGLSSTRETLRSEARLPGCGEGVGREKKVRDGAVENTQEPSKEQQRGQIL